MVWCCFSVFNSANLGLLQALRAALVGEPWGSSVRFNRTETIAAVELWVSDLNVELHTRFDAREINTLFCAATACSACAKGEGRTEKAVRAGPTNRC